MQLKIFTIGVYGSDETSFFKALTDNGIDMFCDIRLRRGMRGGTYAYVNSTYLQNKLKLLGIKYVHYKELAPSIEIRNQQKEADKMEKVAKRSRQQLGDVFIKAYQHDVLEVVDLKSFIYSLAEAQNIVLFCVEREPEACHRSLVAQKLARDLGLEVKHIVL